MNVLYISPMIIDRNNLDGVARKILSQCRAFEQYPEVENVYLASYFENGRYLIIGKNYEKEIYYSKRTSRQLELFEIYSHMIEICSELKIDGVYFRVFALSWVTNKLFKNLKKIGIRTVVEIPTYPFWKEKWMDVFNRIKLREFSTAIKRTMTNIVYFISTWHIKKYIEAIVTFSDIQELWGIRVIGIANGYDFQRLKSEVKLKASDEVLNLLMVASVRDNHGADRVLRGLSNYKKEKGKREVKFHIVGDGDAIPSLKKLVNELGNIEDCVTFYGFKAGEELEKIYDISDIGISALAFHRLGVKYASPLKSKEYFAKGIPVVGTTAEKDIIKSNSHIYYMQIPENDTPVNINEICSFYNNLQQQGYTNIHIAEEAAKSFDWKFIMIPICKILCQK